MNRYATRPEKEVCAGCQFLPTKPEAIDDELLSFVVIASELAEIERSGGRFAYPDSLSAVEWACLKGLTRGRDGAEKLRRERERKEERLKQRKESLGR